MDFSSELFAGIMGFCLFIVGPLCVSIELHRLNKKLKIRDDYDLRISMLENNVGNLINEIVLTEDDNNAN